MGSAGRVSAMLGPVASLPFALDDLRATAAPFADARPLPALAYRDPSVFAFEQASVLQDAWLCVAREDEIQNEGSFVLAPVTDEGVIVVRGADGALRAFYNVCPHRGSTLITPERGPACLERFECPYHGYRFGLDGASSAEEIAGLSPVRVASHGGFVFVTLGDASEGDLLGGAPRWLTRLPPLRRVRRKVWPTRANWKLCVENFQESHHFERVHPALEARTPWRSSRSIVGDGLWFDGVMDLVDAAETVSISARRGARPFVAEEGLRRQVHDAHLFPGMLWSLQPDYLLMYRVRPLAPDLTELTADIYVHASLPEGAPLADVFDFWDVVNDEDRSICERQQIGVSSRGFTGGSYAPSEDGVHGFDRLIARRYLAASAPTLPEPEPEPENLSIGRLWGIWGKPYIDLSHELDTTRFADLDEEISYGLACVPTERTGGSLKWMNVVAPWVQGDGYVDYGQVLEKLDGDEFARFISLAEHPEAFDLDRRSDYTFGDETDHPLTPAQVRYLLYRHRVYFPWRDAYHLLENDRWEDKHSGSGKAFSEEARRYFPKTIAFIESLPFTEIGRAVIFGLEANDHAPLHRDSEPGKVLGVAQSISFSPRGNKRLYLVDPDGGSHTVVRARAYWFNDMDYHGVLADPFFRYSVRVDGVFDPKWVRALESAHRLDRVAPRDGARKVGSSRPRVLADPPPAGTLRLSTPRRSDHKS